MEEIRKDKLSRSAGKNFNFKQEKVLYIILLIFFLLVSGFTFFSKRWTYIMAMDDAYYYFSIARNLASGKGITYTDEWTNGFQPLWLFLITPFFYIFHSPLLPVRFSIFLSGIFFVSSSIWVFKISFFFKRDIRLAFFSSFLWLSNPFVALLAMNGMETGLYLFCLGMLLYYYFKLIKLNPERTIINYMTFGLLSGIAFLSRIDSSIAISLLWIGAVVVELKETSNIKKSFYKLMMGLIVLLILVIPFVGYNIWVWANPMPVSGLAIKEDICRSVDLSLRFFWTIPSLLQLSLFYPLSYFNLIFRPPYNFHIGSLSIGIKGIIFIQEVFLILGVCFWLVICFKNKRIKMAFSGTYFTIFFVLSILYILSYVVFPVAHWFMPRYLLPVHLFLILYVAILWYEALNKNKYLYKGFCYLVLIFCCLIVPVTINNSVDDYQSYRISNISWVKRNISKKDAVASFQSGVYHYYLSLAGYKVYNLDGKVSPEVYRALDEHRLDEFLKRKKIVYLIDWKSFISCLIKEYNLKEKEDYDIIGKLKDDLVVRLKFAEKK